jgi:hypothetical protein
MNSPITDSNVNTLCIRFMNKLINKIQKDRNARVYKSPIFEEACSSSDEAARFDPNNSSLKDRVIEKLMQRGDITLGDHPDDIKITEQGKNKPEYIQGLH